MDPECFFNTQKSAQKRKNTQKSAFESKFTLLSAQKSNQKSGFAKKIFKSCSKLVSKSARNVGYEKIFKSCWPAAALGLSIINVTFRVLRRLEFAADISGTCAQSRELSSYD